MAPRKNNPTFFLDLDYGCDYTKSGAYVRNVYSTIAGASTFFDTAYARWKAEGRTDDKFLDLSYYDASFMDALWKGHAGDMNATCQSRSIINVPAGKFGCTVPGIIAFGQYIGTGTSAFYTSGNSPSAGIPQGSTELYIDHAKWQGNPKDKNIFQSNTWGRDDLYSYNEAFVIDGFRLVGGKTSENPDTSVNCSGIAIWDAGSVSKIGKIFVENFDSAGLYFVRGTPATVEEVTTFRNNVAGVILEGGGMHSFGMVEADENPTVFLVRAGHGRPGTTTLDVKYMKLETGKAPGRDYGKGQMVLDTDDTSCWVNAHFGSINYASVVDFPECAFRVSAGTNTSSVKVDNWTLFGPVRSLFHDVQNNKKWLMDGQLNYNGYWGSRIHGFKWESSGGGNLTTDFGTPTLVTGVAKNRLAVSPIDPMTGKPTLTWNDQAGTPPYQWGGGSVPVNLPQITSFTATPSALSATGDVTLAWTTTNATSVSISGVTGTLPVSGSTKVTVSATTSFTLTATNANGQTTQSVTVTMQSAPVTAYSVTFAGKNPLSLPGCVTVAQWQAPTISGAACTTTSNTNITFSAPFDGIKSMVLKGISGSPGDYQWLNDEVRVVGGYFVLASDTNVKLSQTKLSATKQNITLNFPSPVTMNNLLGTSSYSTAKLTLEGLDLIK